MHAAISHGYSVIATGKFEKRLSTYRREQVKMPTINK